MKFSARLGACPAPTETGDELALVLDLEAPPAPDPGAESGRSGSCLQIVLDRGASMGGAPLEGALDAIAAMAHRLDARDSFGLVTFGDDASVVVPAGPLTDMDDVVDRLAGIRADGPSDLAAGYQRGLAEIGRATDETGGTLLVVSTGHAGHAVEDLEPLEQLARTAHADGIVTSTLSYGQGGVELHLPALARAGSGRHHRAATPSAADAAIASEVADLLARSVQSVSVTVRLDDHVVLTGVDDDVSVTQGSAGTFTLDVGDLYFAERRRIALRLRHSAAGSLPRRLGSLELRYAELPDLTEQRVVLPVALPDAPDGRAVTASPSTAWGW